MLDAIRRFFGEHLEPATGDDGVDPVALASAALLIEVMRADRDSDPEERARVRALLSGHFDLPEAELDELEALAEREVEEATDLYQFTTLINERYGQPERIAMLRNLWSVAWVDGRIDRFEEHLIRRVSDLLHVRHRDFIAAKLATRPEDAVD